MIERFREGLREVKKKQELGEKVKAQRAEISALAREVFGHPHVTELSFAGHGLTWQPYMPKLIEFYPKIEQKSLHRVRIQKSLFFKEEIIIILSFGSYNAVGDPELLVQDADLAIRFGKNGSYMVSNIEDSSRTRIEKTNEDKNLISESLRLQIIKEAVSFIPILQRASQVISSK